MGLPPQEKPPTLKESQQSEEGVGYVKRMGGKGGGSEGDFFCKADDPFGGQCSIMTYGRHMNNFVSTRCRTMTFNGRCDLKDYDWKKLLW